MRYASDVAVVKPEETEVAEEDAGAATRSPRDRPTYEQWMRTIGHNFERPRKGEPNWLSGERAPFPMNPTFRPPRPNSSGLRDFIFKLHVKDPETNSVRALASEFGLSVGRVEAIIKLKGVEQKWKMADKPLRLNFQHEMESALGVKPFNLTSHVHQARIVGNYTLADLAADEDPSKLSTLDHGVQKIWWEGVVDGEEPIVGPHLVALAERRAAKAAQSEAASAEFAASHSHVVEPHVEGRHPTVFIDVGLKFLNAKDEAKRQKAADARRRLKMKPAVRKA